MESNDHPATLSPWTLRHALIFQSVMYGYDPRLAASGGDKLQERLRYWAVLEKRSDVELCCSNDVLHQAIALSHGLDNER